MTIATLKKKAKAGTIEVEDILKAGAAQIEGLADELERLAQECAWTDGGAIVGSTSRIVPLRKWGAVVIAYSRGGPSALVDLLRSEPEMPPFVYGLLEQIHAPASISVILAGDQRVLADPSQDLQRAHRLAAALNLLMSFPPRIDAPENGMCVLLAFLHRLIPLCTHENERATAILALRGLGDSSSLHLLDTQAEFSAPWAEVISVTRRAIKKRKKPEPIQPLQGTPAKAPSSSTEPEGRRP